MAQDRTITVKVFNDVPIGHKLALADLGVGQRSSTAWSSARSSPRSTRASTSTFTISRHGGGNHAETIPRIPSRKRPRRRAQPRRHPPRRRHLQRGLRGGRQQHQGHHWRCPHPYGRLQFGADLDLQFRYLIGTGANPNVAAVVVIGIEPGLDKPVVEGIAATGKPVAGFSHRKERRSQHHHGTPRGRPRSSCTGPASFSAGACDLADLWVSTKCGESDTTSGLGSRTPPSGNVYDKLLPAAALLAVSARPRRSPAAEDISWPSAARSLPRSAEAGTRSSSTATEEVIERAQGRRPLRLAAHQGQHRGRSDHHRGEGAWATSRRSARKCGTSAQLDKPPKSRAEPGLYFMDSSSAAAEMASL